MNNTDKILLVSGSPRRRELLDMIGVQFDALNADVDESALPGESPEDYVNRLAVKKALAGIEMRGSALPALGADTIVLLKGRIIGKPSDPVDAMSMLSDLSGQSHEVLSAVAIATGTGQVVQDMNRTRVHFGEIPRSWIEIYCQTPEPMDKAGAYAIQGLAGQWVRRIEGSYSGVMGLPLFETSQLLRISGLALEG